VVLVLVCIALAFGAHYKKPLVVEACKLAWVGCILASVVVLASLVGVASYKLVSFLEPWA
jgi:hypothetical protein